MSKEKIGKLEDIEKRLLKSEKKIEFLNSRRKRANSYFAKQMGLSLEVIAIPIQKKAQAAFETANTALGDTTKLLVEHKRLSERVEKLESSIISKTETVPHENIERLKCPDCGTLAVRKERNPNGYSDCMECGLKLKHSEWQKRVEDRIKDLAKEKENSEKPNNQENYPAHWPRKADGSGVQVGDEIEFNNPETTSGFEVAEVKEIKGTKLGLFHQGCEGYLDWQEFGCTANWNEGYQFRFPEEQTKHFDRERALELLAKIQKYIHKPFGRYVEGVDLDIKELRQLLGGE